MELSEAAQQFSELGVAMVGLTYDTPEQLAKFTARRDIAFPIYSDVDSAVIRSLGLLNEGMPKGTKYYGVPYPGIFLLDPERKIVAKFAEQSYRDRPAVEDLLEAARKLADAF